MLFLGIPKNFDLFGQPRVLQSVHGVCFTTSYISAKWPHIRVLRREAVFQQPLSVYYVIKFIVVKLTLTNSFFDLLHELSLFLPPILSVKR